MSVVAAKLSSHAGLTLAQFLQCGADDGVLLTGGNHPAAFQFTLLNAFLLSVSPVIHLPSVNTQTIWIREQHPLLW